MQNTGERTPGKQRGRRHTPLLHHTKMCLPETIVFSYDFQLFKLNQLSQSWPKTH